MSRPRFLSVATTAARPLRRSEQGVRVVTADDPPILQPWGMLLRRFAIAALGVLAALVVTGIAWYGGLIIGFGACDTDGGYADAKENNFMCNGSTGSSLYDLVLLFLPLTIVVASTGLAVRWSRAAPVLNGTFIAVTVAVVIFALGYHAASS